MKKIIFISILLSLAFTNTVFTQKLSKEEAQKRYEKAYKDKQDEFIQDFLDELDVDEFQKEIIKQKLYSYIQEKQVLFKEGLKSYELEGVVEKLNETHFLDIQDLISKDTMNKIQELIKGENKKKKKKKKRKNKS